MSMKKLYIKIGEWLGYLPEGLHETWHLCNHDWKTKMVDANTLGTNDRNKRDEVCVKCNVQKVEDEGFYSCTPFILVNPQNNRPYRIDPWGINIPPTKSLNSK